MAGGRWAPPPSVSNPPNEPISCPPRRPTPAGSSFTSPAAAWRSTDGHRSCRFATSQATLFAAHTPRPADAGADDRHPDARRRGVRMAAHGPVVLVVVHLVERDRVG